MENIAAAVVGATPRGCPFCHYESCGGALYDVSKQFCYNGSKVGEKCGDNVGTYDPDLYECKPDISDNGIYLKGGIKDTRDGNEYKAVQIGEQTWMAENLKYDIEGSSMCSNDAVNDYCEIYGKLYMQSAIVDICPAGWHLPSQPEWEKLRDEVGTLNNSKLKAVNVWNTGTAGTDFYGFAALPGGGSGGMTTFAFGTTAAWWISNNSVLSMSSGNGGFSITIPLLQTGGYRSVRCLKN